MCQSNAFSPTRNNSAENLEEIETIIVDCIRVTPDDICYQIQFLRTSWTFELSPKCSQQKKILTGIGKKNTAQIVRAFLVLVVPESGVVAPPEEGVVEELLKGRSSRPWQASEVKREGAVPLGVELAIVLLKGRGQLLLLGHRPTDDGDKIAHAVVGLDVFYDLR